jgi:hypothetical protein
MLLLATPPPPPCVPAGGHVLLRRNDSAVFTTDDAFAACSGTERAVRLGARLPTPGFFRRVSTFRLAGHDVAFVVNRDGPGRSPATVKVVDLRARRTVSAHAATGHRARPDRSDEVTSLVLRRDGAAGWIVVTRTTAPRPAAREVRATRAHGHSLRLDAGRGIALRSLRLHGHRLSWRHDGQRRTAPF